MLITDSQLSKIKYALVLARYFCDEHENGLDQIQNELDYETYHDAIKTILEIEANHVENIA